MIRHAWGRGIFYRAVWLCLAGCGAGVLANALRDRGQLSWTPGVFPPLEREIRSRGIDVIRHEAFETARRQGGVVVDARPQAGYRDGHVPGALSLPAHEAFEVLLAHAPVLFEAGWVGVYGTDAFSEDGAEVARMLKDCGLPRVHFYAGGYADWRARRKARPGGDAP